jgi:predicted metalloprotease with PDZ domain
MSMQAPFVDAAAAIDPNNRANTFISYYTWGAAIGLGLDLTLRSRFDVTLDDFMRAMWTRFGKTEQPYTVEDARDVLGDVTRDAAFARDFFDRYVLGRDVVDYAALLARAGFLVRPANAGRATFGAARFALENGNVTLVAAPLVGSPLYEAGIEAGDRIVSIDGTPATRAEQLAEFAAAHRPGDVARVAFHQRGSDRTATITLVEDPTLEVVTFEAAGRPVSEEIRRFRAAWLHSKANR